MELWIKEDDERAKSAFEISAVDVISKLRTIKSDLGLKERSSEIMRTGGDDTTLPC